MARLGITARQLKLRLRKLRARRALARLRHIDVPDDPLQAFELALGAGAAALMEEAHPLGAGTAAAEGADGSVEGAHTARGPLP